MNVGTVDADTPRVKGTDSYFVRLDGSTPTGPQGRRGSVAREPFEASEGPHNKRRRKRFDGRSFLLVLLLIALGSWFVWASQRPGGVSGTINGWIEATRGDVASVSADPDFHEATDYYDRYFDDNGMYPQMSESDLASVGIGMGVGVEWCSRNAVVLQGSVGGGTASRLLLGGEEIGTESGRHLCPRDFDNPTPWNN